MFNLLVRRFIIGGQTWVSMHCWFIVFTWHTNQWWITAGFVTAFCSNDMMSMVSNTLCSHFYCQGSYYTAHTLVLNFTIKSWTESLQLCHYAWPLSEANLTTVRDLMVLSLSTLPLSVVVHSHIHGITGGVVTQWGVHHVNFQWTWICFSTCANLKFPFVQFIILVYGHAHVRRHTYTCILQCSMGITQGYQQ